MTLRKKFLTGILVFSMLVCAAGCGKGSADGRKEPSASAQTGAETGTGSGVSGTESEESKSMEAATQEETKTSEAEASETETSKESAAEPSKEPEKKPASKKYKVPQNEGTDFARGLKIGWNLGNTFDAYDCNWLSNGLDYETAWQNTKTTKDVITALKDAGFASVRIPVSWHNHVDVNNNYAIDGEWLERVAEVVDYCMEEDMFVILNIHHDNSKKFLYPTNEYLDQSLNYVTSIWTQLSERFQDYDERLIFEGMNEPRLVGHANEWWLNNSDDCNEAVACINQLNQAFVDTVRASGGNNATRFLMCPGYCASPEGALSSGFVFPTDPVDNDHHIMLTIHAYTPYRFALESPGTDTWSSKNPTDVSDMTGFMNRIYYQYLINGTPVVIDEFGAVDKNGNLEARVDFAGSYVAAAKERGMVCFWWDNHNMSGSGELFTILERASCQWKYPEIVRAMMEALEE